MRNGKLRTTEPDEFLSSVLNSDDAVASPLGQQLFGFGAPRDSKQTQAALAEAARATVDDVRQLAGRIAPPLADAVALAWQRLEQFTIALSSWTLGEPVAVENRAIWLRDLLRELARFELPPNREDALLWLAIYSGTFVPKDGSDIASLMKKLLGLTVYRFGNGGCDHVGRLLACEIALNKRVADNLIDTLRLVGTCRHPAIPAEIRNVPSPHVTRALAGCGREEAIEALCATIEAERGSSELATSAAVEAVAAAAEVLTIFPNVLPSVLETIATQIVKGEIDHQSLAAQLATVLAMPPRLLEDETNDAVLLACAAALREPARRQQMMASHEPQDLFLACWAEATLSISVCASRLLERYEQACSDGCEDEKLLLRSFARFREGHTLVMRPMWLCILKESLGDSSDQLNVALVAEAFDFGNTSGHMLPSSESIPRDAAIDLLVEIEKRLQDETRMAELVKVSSLKSAQEIRNRLVRLIILNLEGRNGDALLPFVDRMDVNSIGSLVDADLSKTDAKTRSAIMKRANPDYPHGPKLMVRAVAAAESTEELLDWLLTHQRLNSAADPLFAIACALRPDRVELWRALLLATKKDLREFGLQFVIATLKVIDSTGRFSQSKLFDALTSDVVIDAVAIRCDASRILDEYEARQRAKKNGDNLKAHTFISVRELSRTSDEIESEVASQRAALTRLCERVAEMTGIDRSRFKPSPAQPPHDCGTRYADLFGKAAPRLIESAASLLPQLEAETRDHEEQSRRFSAWFESRGQELREPDGSEQLRVHQWFSGPGYWQYFDAKVLNRAKPLMSAEQLQRISELRPPVLKVAKMDSVRRLFQSLKWSAACNYEDMLLVELSWYESVLANLPAEIQQLGPRAEHSVAPHPPHEQALASVMMNAKEFLRSHRNQPRRQERVRQRMWPLLWWAAAFGGRVDGIDFASIGFALSSGQASLGDLVWFLIQPGYAQKADNLIEAVKDPDRMYLGIDVDCDKDIQAVVQAVAAIGREQEAALDPTLPPILATTWPKLPAPQDQGEIREILTKHADIAYQPLGRTNDQQKAFVNRIRECLSAAEKSWLVAADYFAPHYIKFDILDAWIENTTSELHQLVQERIVPEETLLRIALHHPLLMRSVLEATGRKDQLDAVIWILFHARTNLTDLAITLRADTGHAALRQPDLSTQQICQRLLDDFAPEIGKREKEFGLSPVDYATIRRSWKQSAINAQPREKLLPWFNALKAIESAAERKLVEGLLDAMEGRLSDASDRKQLELSIKDRPNLALLQLALLPLPQDHAALVTEVSKRVAVFERLAVEGRKRKSSEAQANMQRGLDQARRTLADNAGLADPSQLEWLTGEAITKELAEFQRVESGDYLIQLRLRGDGPQVLITKAGKSLKSLPAAFKSSEKGKQLVKLQKRLQVLQRDTRAVLEAAMIEQRSFSPDQLKMMMKHPVVAAMARELVFVMKPTLSETTSVVGLPSDDAKQLIGCDETQTAVSQPVYIAHPLELDHIGVLRIWQSYMTDHPPQAFQQLDRAIMRADDLETADEGKRIVRHDGVQLANEDQAFRILQAHGWHDNREIRQLCRTFAIASAGATESIFALLADFMWPAGFIGTLEFRDSNWNELAIADVPALVLSEAIRDIDRTVAGTNS